EALLLLTDQDSVRVAGSTPLDPKTEEILRSWQRRWEAEGMDWAATLVGSRYEAIGKLSSEVVLSPALSARTVSDRIDAVVTHPLWGWIVLVAVMTLLFVSIFQFAQAPMEWIGEGNAALSNLIKRMMAEGDLRNLLTDGVIGGVGNIVMFLPHIPLLSSYACAIPGIMATRTIEEPKDRLVTILVAPLMSCSARLPVYLLMIAALLPGASVPIAAKVGIMILMYALGTVGAFCFAWLFKSTLLRGKPPLMIMELPPYRLPRLRDVFLHMVERAGLFLKNAGTIILAISVVLWFLAAYPKAPAGANATQQLAQSFAGRAGHATEPLIKPIGFDWQIGIGLI